LPPVYAQPRDLTLQDVQLPSQHKNLEFVRALRTHA
jgi:hypothetical protein